MTDTTVHDAPLASSIRYAPLIVCLLVGAAVWFGPKPELISEQGWHLLAIFLATILGLIINPLPMGAVCIVSFVITTLTNTLTPQQAFEGFDEQIVWLVVFALFIAKGFEATGLGKRVAYFFMGLLGKRSLGLSYGLVVTDLIISPAIPSVTGRMAGIVYPILRGIANTFKSFPHTDSSRHIGAFLTVTSFQCSAVTSSMFMTAMAANPLLARLTSDQNINLSWGKWALAAIVPGLVSLLIVPLVIYCIYPPSIKTTPEASLAAKTKLKELGKMRYPEWVMTLTVVLLLFLWGMGKTLGISPAVAAMGGLSVLLLTGVLEWKSLIKMDTAWETFIWFSVIIMLANYLNQMGVIQWFSNNVQSQLGTLDWKLALPVLALLYFYSHYLFASASAHVASMYVPFLVLALGLGTPPMLAVLVFIFCSNLFGGLTHYSLSHAPLLFGAGYVHIKDWWKIGFIISLINIIIWSTIGIAWWKLLGFW
ncbi:MAG TPA: DASS family sodium-coupled anion symporter [Gammaproteobacteria bacterium]|nr:DASS family sodium-coupled anion symporter [Gammaproteobacteria bacterium]